MNQTTNPRLPPTAQTPPPSSTYEVFNDRVEFLQAHPSLKQISRRHLQRDGRSCTLSTTELVHQAYLKLARPRAGDLERRP